MKNKIVVYLAILLISLLAISSVNASEMDSNIDFNNDILVMDAGELSNENLENEIQMDDNFQNECFKSNDYEISVNSLNSDSKKLSSDTLENSISVNGDSFNDIQNAINSAQDNDIIILGNQRYSGNKPIDIIRPITIKSSTGQTILDGYNSSIIFNIYSSNVKLINLNFINGPYLSEIVDSEGDTESDWDDYEKISSAICFYEDYGFLSNCSFVNSSVYWAGAARNGTLSNCSFVNSSVYWAGSWGTLEKSKFFDTDSDSNHLVFWEGSSGKLSNCSFINCFSWSDNKNVLWSSHEGIISDCTFKNCSSSSGGGAIYLVSDSPSISNSKFINCDSSSSGGAIYWHQNAFYGTISKCSFVNCSSEKAGGAIYSDCYGNSAFYPKNIINCVFNNCLAEKYGGAIYSYDFSGQIKNNNFTNCYADSSGGAIFIEKYNSGYGNSNISVTGSIFKNCSSKNSGGAIYIYSQRSVFLTNDNFLKCKCDYYGGAIYLFVENLQAVGSNVSSFISKITVNDSSSKDGGAIYLSGNKSIVNNCIFYKNYASEFGGAIYYEATEGYINGSYFVKNTAGINDDIYGFVTKNKNTYGHFPSSLKITQSGSCYKNKTLTITLKDTIFNKPIVNQKLTIKFSNGKSVTVTTNSKGVASYKIPYNVGTYTATVSGTNSIYSISTTKSTVKITKIQTTIKAPKVTYKYKKSKYFSVTVKNKATKKVVKSLKVKVKVYTGKKYKTYTIKTNSKGIAKLNTKTLAKGTHKVVISSGNSNYAISAKSTIVIKK